MEILVSLSPLVMECVAGVAHANRARTRRRSSSLVADQPERPCARSKVGGIKQQTGALRVGSRRGATEVCRGVTALSLTVTDKPHRAKRGFSQRGAQRRGADRAGETTKPRP